MLAAKHCACLVHQHSARSGGATPSTLAALLCTARCKQRLCFLTGLVKLRVFKFCGLANEHRHGGSLEVCKVLATRRPVTRSAFSMLEGCSATYCKRPFSFLSLTVQP